MSQLNKYYNDVEKTFKDEFKKSRNNVYYVPKQNLDEKTCKQIASSFSKSIKELKYLDHGSFGSVSLCKVEGIPEYCVTKTVINFTPNDDLKNEIEALELTWKCPFTPKLLYAGYKPSQCGLQKSYVLVLECISGGDLFHHFMNSDLKVDAMKVIFYQISKAIDFLHQHHRTHGDLKPENVGLTAKGHVKLFDFGKSRNVSKPCILPRATLTYDSPEVLKCITADASIDWWAYGVLVAAMLQDEYPFYDKDDTILEKMIINDEPTLDDIDDPDAKDFVMKLLQKDPANRLVKTPWKHNFFNGVNSKVPLFIPGDVVSKLVNEKPKLNGLHGDLNMDTRAEQTVLNASLLRYPTRECLKLMKNKEKKGSSLCSCFM